MDFQLSVASHLYKLTFVSKLQSPSTQAHLVKIRENIKCAFWQYNAAQPQWLTGSRDSKKGQLQFWRERNNNILLT